MCNITINCADIGEAPVGPAYEVVHQTIEPAADPGLNLVQVDAPAGKFVTTAFTVPGIYRDSDHPIQEFVFDPAGNITAARFQPSSLGFGPAYEAYIVCVNA
jgi:hypothetical protein